MSKELITLFGTGSIPGIPGSHGAGTYEVDYEARTLVPFVAAPEPDGDGSPTAVGGNPPETSAPEPVEEAEQAAPPQEAVQPTEAVPAPEEGA